MLGARRVIVFLLGFLVGPTHSVGNSTNSTFYGVCRSRVLELLQDPKSKPSKLLKAWAETREVRSVGDAGVQVVLVPLEPPHPTRLRWKRKSRELVADCSPLESIVRAIKFLMRRLSPEEKIEKRTRKKRKQTITIHCGDCAVWGEAGPPFHASPPRINLCVNKMASVNPCIFGKGEGCYGCDDAIEDVLTQ